MKRVTLDARTPLLPYVTEQPIELQSLVGAHKLPFAPLFTGSKGQMISDVCVEFAVLCLLSSGVCVSTI